VLTGDFWVKHALDEDAAQGINKKDTQIPREWSQEKNMPPEFAS
jgi:hypothetical protein